jgi:hypothetical protein
MPILATLGAALATKAAGALASKAAGAVASKAAGAVASKAAGSALKGAGAALQKQGAEETQQATPIPGMPQVSWEQFDALAQGRGLKY